MRFASFLYAGIDQRRYGLCGLDDGLRTYAEGIGPGSDIRAGDSTVDGDITVINMSIVSVESLASHGIGLA